MHKDFIILGASGDLTKKKLLPAIYQNYKSKNLDCRYIGYGRKDLSEKQFQSLVKKSTGSKEKKFLNKFSYIQGSYNTEGLNQLTNSNLSDHRIFYLSIPTEYHLFKEILKGLSQNNLITKNTIIAIEKPFGTDTESAKILISLLKEYLNESQIFLVDHYLAKNLIRNLITLRFANPIFSNIWNKEHIEKIEIITKETTGIDGRGEFYDQTGAIKDMIQNHSLQVLSLVTMNIPKDFTNSSISTEKGKILSNLIRPDNNIELGQYEGYLEEEYVKEGSLTETYAKVTVEIDTEGWNGIPISMITGKKQDEKRTEIHIFFKGNKDCLWEGNCKQLTSNMLTINLYPENNIVLKINSEFNPSQNLPKSTDLTFSLNEEDQSLLPYANTLIDIYNKDKTYTPSYEEILLSWKFIDALEKQIEGIREDILFKY